VRRIALIVILKFFIARSAYLIQRFTDVLHQGIRLMRTGENYNYAGVGICAQSQKVYFQETLFDGSKFGGLDEQF
jgi:predicted HAD superfamily hydrolase